MRGGLLLKFLALTVAFGLLMDALILGLYYSYRRDQLVGEMSAQIATLATRLARPLARASGDDPGQVRDLLGVFAGFSYVVCVDFRASAERVPSSWPQIGCERMKPGLDLTIPAPLAGEGARYEVRLDERVLADGLRREFTILGALALLVSLAIWAAATLVFQRILTRPLHRLVHAMERFEVENVPQKVAWNARDEMGEAARRYNAMLDREVARVAEIRESRKKLSDLVERLQEARDEANRARERAEQALVDLQKAQDRLVQTEKMASLGQLTAGIAHEIKNPLNFVNNFASLSRELLDELKQLFAPAIAALGEADRAEARELLETLDTNLSKVSEHGARADRIIRNMLLHSRQGPGERSRTSVNALVEESLNLAYHGARAEDHDFQIRLDKRLGAEAGEIDAYPHDLVRVLVNLFSNGFHAVRLREAKGAAGGFEPTLRVTTIGRAEEVEIRVRDNGVGIPEEVRGKLFTPFFTTKPPGEGTGLGLSLSHDIVVKQHGGSVAVESEPGRFTEFTIVIPRAGPGATVAHAAGT